jgi:fumarate hydratase class II
MERDHASFCVRQFAKIRTLAEDAGDPVLKDQLMRIADDWRALASGPVAGRPAEINAPTDTTPR